MLATGSGSEIRVHPPKVTPGDVGICNEAGRDSLTRDAKAPTSGEVAGRPGGAKMPKKKKKLYPHGNYHNYYGYRALGSFDEDPRLRLMRAEWFRGRHVLDVGCNEGLVTLAVAAGVARGSDDGSL